MLKILGILLIVNALIFTAWWYASGNDSKVWVGSLCALAVFAGLALTLSDRITELTVKGVGTIKAATEQATADAKTVHDLKERVENQSATVDLVAKQAALAKALSEQVEKQVGVAAERLASLDAAAARARAVLEFTELVVAAQNDDRTAFDKLLVIANDSNSDFSKKAEAAYRTIFDAHSKSMYSTGFTVPWDPNVDPAKFGLLDLAREFSAAPVALKPALLEYIAKRGDIPRVDRMELFIQVLKNDPSLTATEYAGRNFTAMAGLQIKPMAIEYLEQWWRDNRQNFVDK